MNSRVFLLPALLACVSVLDAQQRAPSDGGRTPSLGQPGFWKVSAGAAMGEAWREGDQQLTTELRASVSRSLGNPVVGLAALQFEGFSGTRDGELDGGVRARLHFPFARLGVGADHNLVDGRTRLLLSLVHPGRRGGLFSDGSQLRLDLAPGRDRTIALGIEKPIQRRIPPGRSRPGRSTALLSGAVTDDRPVPMTPAVREAVAEARAAAAWLGEFTVPWLDHTSSDRRREERIVRGRIAEMRTGLSGGASGAPRTTETEARRLHAAIDRAFATAIAEALGSNGDGTAAHADMARLAAQHARDVMLDEVLLPYDRLLGQVKREDTTRGLARRARGIYLRWLHVEAPVPAAAFDATLGVFVAMLDIVEENRAAIRARWKDSRHVWLPLQYALRPEEHDTQGELDALLERASGERFTGGNLVSYVINEQYQFHVSRTIRAAEDYHVMWIHDIRGTDDQGDPDELSYRHVTRSYLRALIERVRAYDRTGKLPTYTILLDEWFYSIRESRLWMSLLEDPLRHRVSLPRGFRAWEDSLEAVQDTLRAAVAASQLLQAQRAEFGDGWLHDLVKVHVNITHASDPSFASRNLVRGVPIPDNMLRDHRKLVFYDLSEEDPYRGEAIFTGAGLGEHYANESWEDRSLLVRGPATLQLKAAARELLLSQGVTPERLPWHLRARARAPDYDARVQAAAAAGPRTLRAMVLHNEVGYGDKAVNVGKAILYTLMPSGSVLKVPDSLWNSPFWGAALTGCALRGGRVLVIAPALANVPVPAFGSMEHSHDLMWRLVAVSQSLAPELQERGGLLRVGIFASTLLVSDIPGKVAAVRRTFAEHAWLRELYGFPPSIYAQLAEAEATLRPVPMTPTPMEEFESKGFPKLHLKANTFASREAWTLMTRPEWMDMSWEFLTARIAQVQSREAALKSFDGTPDALLDVGDGTVQRWLDALPDAARDRVVFYTVMGSHNMNARSLVTDGEDALVASAWPSVIPYIDFMSLVGQSVWLEDPAEVARFIPPYSRLKSRLAHWFRLAF